MHKLLIKNPGQDFEAPNDRWRELESLERTLECHATPATANAGRRENNQEREEV